MATYEGIIDIVTRISEAGNTRISEAGDIRIAEQWEPESVTANDTLLALWAAGCPIAESVAVSDSVSCQVVFQGVIAESADVSDSVLPAWVAECILSESGTSNDVILPAWIAECILAESGTSNDSTLTLWIAGCILAESSTSDDSTLAVRHVYGTATESAGVSDATIIAVTRFYTWLTIEGNENFVIGDMLRIKDGNDDEWLEVVNPTLAPKYGVIRDKAADYVADSNPAWTKGAAVVNYGQSGDGGIYMTASETNAPYMSVITHAGSPWDAITTHIRMGNLNGYAGYSSKIFGWAAYIDANNYIKIDPTNGIRMSGEIIITGGSMPGLTLDDLANGASYGRVQLSILDSGYLYLLRKSADSTERLLVTAGGIEAYANNVKNFELASGIAYLGDQANEHIKLSSSGIQIYDGASLYATYGATIYLGLTAAEHIKISSSGIQIYDGASLYATYGAITTLGLVASEHISLSATAIQFKDGANVYTELAAGILKLGLVSGGEYIHIDSTGIEGYGGAVKRFEITSAGLVYLGDQSNEHIKLSSSGLQIYDGATQLALYGATTLIGREAANQSNVKISAGQLEIRNNVTSVITLAANGDVTLTGEIVGTTNIPDGAVTQIKMAYSAGDSFIISADTERTMINVWDTWFKTKEIRVVRTGTLRIKFDMLNGYAGGGTVYGQIRKNGNVVGALRSDATGTIYVTYSEDIAGWTYDDLCQLYYKGTTSRRTKVKNFRLYSTNKENVTYDAN